MALVETEFFLIDSSENSNTVGFLTAAYQMINDNLDIIESFFNWTDWNYYVENNPDASREDYIKSIDGTRKVEIRLTNDDTGHEGRRAAAWAAARFLNDGVVTIWRPYFDCMLAIYESGSGGWGSNLPRRYAALIDLMTVAIVHETGHVVWHGEDFCSGLEGFYRHWIQASLDYFPDGSPMGKTIEPMAAQVRWDCSADFTSEACSGQNLQDQEQSIVESEGSCNVWPP